MAESAVADKAEKAVEKSTATSSPKAADWLGDFVDGKVGTEGSPRSDAPVVDVAKVEPKVESKPAESKAVEPPKEKAKAEPKAETKPEDKSEDKTEKRLKDTQKWANDVNQRNLALQSQLTDVNHKLETLSKKLDGTYEEPPPADARDIERKAVEHTKLAASHYAAVEMLNATGVDGEAEVQRLVWSAEAPFQELQKDPAIYARVMNAKLPIVEALKVVKESETRKQYGETPEAMKAALKRELEAEHKQQIETIKKEERQAVLDEMRGKSRRPVEPVAGLSGVRGATREESKDSDAALNIETLFPNFQKTAGS